MKFCKDCIIKEVEELIDYINFGEHCDYYSFKKEEIEEVKRLLDEDVKFCYESDPAANSIEEIKLTYPGYLAICFHRLAYILYNKGKKLEARLISEHAHGITGIDIHPATKMGCPVFIDHGTGVVIGETAVIGNYVILYQGVTLGALSPDKGQAIKGSKRHPTIGNHVVIYANASIIGDITIGDNVTIGGNLFITEDVAPNQRVVMSKPQFIYKNN